MAERQMLKKLSAKTVMGKVTVPEKETLLYTVYGRANGVTQGESTYGPWAGLLGEFEALRADDGKTFIGNKAFLPNPINDIIVAKLTEIKEAEDAGKDAPAPKANALGTVNWTVKDSVEFAIEVIIAPSDAPVGYEFFAREVIDMSESDSLAHLRQKVLPNPDKGKQASGKAKAEA